MQINIAKLHIDKIIWRVPQPPMVKHRNNPFVVHAAELLNCPRFVRNNRIDPNICELASEYLRLVNRRYRDYHLGGPVLHLQGISWGRNEAEP
jgi:hypothetical protein